MNIVYKLYCKDIKITDFYIGSSTNFRKRKTAHKSICNNPNNKMYNLKVYKFIRTNGGFQNFEFEILIETIEDNIKILEQKYIKELKPTLNCYNACGMVYKEYQKLYRLNNKQKMKEYYQNNKQKIKEKNRLYNELNKKKIRLYYQKNKQKLIEKQRLYRLKQKLIHNDLKN